MTVPTNNPAALPTDEVAEIDLAWLAAALGAEATEAFSRTAAAEATARAVGGPLELL